MLESFPVKVFVTEYGRNAGIKVHQPSFPGDCGVNVEAPYEFWILPGTCRKMWTGLDIDIPLEGFEINGLPFGINMTAEGRTSRQLKLVEPGPREFDARYRVKKNDPKGIVVGIKNTGWLPYHVKKHEEIMQLIFRPYLKVRFEEVENQNEIRRDTAAGSRKDGRFGSSDKNKL